MIAADPDVALMLRAQRDDQRAFAELFTKYKKRMINYARRYLGSSERAEDAAQEVFLRLYRARADYQPQTTFKPYLYRIATNTCLNHLRKRDWLVRERPDDDGGESATDRIVDHAPIADQALSGEQLQKVVQRALNDLPESQRTALVLLRFEDLSYEEIAHAMDSTVPAIKALLNRAKEQLLTRLGPHLDGFVAPYRKETP